MMILRTLYNYLPRPTCGNEIKWNGFLLGKAKKEDVPCRFCGKTDGDGHLFWECTFLPSNMVGNCLSSLQLCPWIAASGPDVCFGMGGCLDLVVLVTVTLGLPLLGI